MKVWLGIITQDSEKDVKELLEVAPYFDGVAAVCHEPINDGTYDLLNKAKGDGFVIKRPYYFHNGHSMNEFLLNPTIKINDWIVLRDSSERLNTTFAKEIKNFAAMLNKQGVETVIQRGKILMFKRWFNQQFVNGIHWGLSGARSKYVEMEKCEGFKDNDESYAYSLRNENRPKDHRYYHECKYIIDYGVNGNHIQLFHPNSLELEKHQNELAKFFDLLDGLGIKNATQLIEYWKTHSLTEEMTHHINLERPFRNAYRYFVLTYSNEEILKNEDEWRLTWKTTE